MEGEDQKIDQIVNKSQKGKIWPIFILALLLIGAGVGGYFVFTGRSLEIGKTTNDIRWELMDDGNYRASSTPPGCPSPLVLDPPTDLSKVVSVLYPGQSRGGDYKPHGGLRFADNANEAIITAPMDASVVNGSRYIESGEIQYLFSFVNSCGIQYRLDHLRVLSPSFATLAEKLPAAQEDDSRTTEFNPPAEIKAGDIIATTVGIINSGNAGFDFGVYDLRQQNEASKDPSFRTANADDPGQAWHALCWFDLFSANNEAKVRSLPATANNSQSDYCK